MPSLVRVRRFLLCPSSLFGLFAPPALGKARPCGGGIRSKSPHSGHGIVKTPVAVQHIMKDGASTTTVATCNNNSRVSRILFVYLASGDVIHADILLVA